VSITAQPARPFGEGIAYLEIIDVENYFTKSRLALTFDEIQRGKTIYFCLRWENNNGEKGS
jgi:hypothetical protein